MLVVQVSGIVSDDSGVYQLETHMLGCDDTFFDYVSEVHRMVKHSMATDEVIAPIIRKDRFGDARKVGWRVSSQSDGVYCCTEYIVKAMTSTGKFRKVWFN